MADQTRIHIVVLTYPAQGHINPLLQFAKRLAAKGLKTTLATTPYTLNSIHSSTVNVEPISDGFDEGGFKQATSVASYLESFKEFGTSSLSDLILKFSASGSPVACIVYDSLLPWALDVAKRFGIASAVLLTNSASVCSLFWQIDHGLLTLPVKQETAATVSLPGLPPLRSCDWPSFLSNPASQPAYLAAILEKFHNLEENDWVLCNSFENLEIELVKALKGQWSLKMIGPLIPSAYLDQEIDGDTAYGANFWKPESDNCLKWLDTKPSQSVVYVSFGSMSNVSTKQVEELAWGLKASKKPFLWVLRDPQDKLPGGFLNSVDETGLIVPWCNQLEVLAHQAVGCFITHCGWNSTLEGLSLGVPMVGVVQWSDQPMNAKFVEEVWKVGVRGVKDEEGILTGKELDRCIREVMDGEKCEEIRRNASKWKDLAKEAASVGGSSDLNINEFVAKLLEGKKIIT